MVTFYQLVPCFKEWHDMIELEFVCRAAFDATTLGRMRFDCPRGQASRLVSEI